MSKQGDIAAAELRRRHPELFAVAEDIIRRAGTESARPQAVWLYRGEWFSGPMDGAAFAKRHKASLLAGVYTHRSTQIEIVQDIFMTMGGAR